MHCPSAQHCSVALTEAMPQEHDSKCISHDPPQSMPALFQLFPLHSGNIFFIILTSLHGYMHDHNHTKID